jgi:hypothetical protein
MADRGGVKIGTFAGTSLAFKSLSSDPQLGRLGSNARQSSARTPESLPKGHT